MSQEYRIDLECTECKNKTHTSHKNKKKLRNAGRLELKKHCKFCGKHTLHKESK